jgi:hypothetical protein
MVPRSVRHGFRQIGEHTASAGKKVTRDGARIRGGQTESPRPGSCPRWLRLTSGAKVAAGALGESGHGRCIRTAP